MKKKIEDTIPEKIVCWAIVLSMIVFPISAIIIIWYWYSDLLIKILETSWVTFVTGIITGIFIFTDNDK